MSIAPAIALYAALLALLYSQVLFGGMVPASPDSMIPEALNRALGALHEQTGRYPLWQPWIFSGMPTVEAFSYLSGLYYPNLLFSLLGMQGPVLQLLHLLGAGVGAFLLARSMQVGRTGSFLAGAAFMLNPYLTAMFVQGHGSQLMTASFMPWLLLGTLKVLRGGGVGWAGMLALVAGFQLQRSHVQVAWYSWLLVALLVLFVLVEVPRSRRAGRIALLLVALAAGVAMSAAIYLPASGYAPWSVRGMAGSGSGAAWEYATAWSMHPLELATFIVPGLFGFGGAAYWGFMPFTDFPFYAGIIVLFLASAALPSLRRSPLWLFVLTALLLALLLSFGGFFPPLYALFYKAAPLFSRFRVPSMALLMAFMALALLAGRGVDRLKAAAPGTLEPVLRVVSVAVALPAALFLLFSEPIEALLRSLFPRDPSASFSLAWMIDTLRWESVESSFLLSAALLLLAIALLWLASKRYLGKRGLLLLLVAAAVFDLLWLDGQIIAPSRSSLRSAPMLERERIEEAFVHDEATTYLASEGGGMRIYPAGRLFGQTKFALFGIESVGGYHPAKLARYQEFLEESGNLANLQALRLLSVGHVVSMEPVGHPSLELVGKALLRLPSGQTEVYLYRLAGALPRAWFASRVMPVEGRGALVDAVLTSGDEPGLAFVDAAGGKPERRFAEGRVLAMERRAEEIVVEVSAAGEAFLVLSEMHYPLRWRAAIDGTPVAVEEVNGLLRGLVVPGGDHTVRFSYDRHAFETGRRISLAGFTLSLLFLGVGAAGRLRAARPAGKGKGAA